MGSKLTDRALVSPFRHRHPRPDRASRSAVNIRTHVVSKGRPRGTGRLAPYETVLVRTVEAKPDLPMPELAARLGKKHGIRAAPATLSRLLCRQGFTYKKQQMA